MAKVFPDPAHDHTRCAENTIAKAEDICARRARRLTPMRRQVLSVLSGSHKPLGAYEIIERLGETGGRPAPISVYRALAFLLEHGLVHRIESRNAYLACVNNHALDATVVFLICERCGSIGEAPSANVAATLAAAAASAGFKPTSLMIEIGGVCSHCEGATRN